MALETELETFAEIRGSLLANHTGQFALVYEGELVATYTTFSEAYQAGIRANGLHPFLVRQIAAEDPTVFPAGVDLDALTWRLESVTTS